MEDEPANRRAILAWRRDKRTKLIDARRALGVASHRAASRAIERELAAHFSDLAARLVAFYWPFQREFDPLPCVKQWIARGGRAALPVVVEKNRPLEFRRWRPGAKMALGVYDIPYPAEGKAVTPEALLVPMVGFDRAGYRLGYGGGYYDRTLAALPKKPLCIGLCFALGRIDSIHPLPHDMPMDFIVTEEMTARRTGNRLQAL
jgi:5-formyltetrahydrofolate cyclo-ligase